MPAKAHRVAGKERRRKSNAPVSQGSASKARYHRTQSIIRMNRSDGAVIAGIGVTRVTTALDAIRVHTRRRSLGRASQRIPIASVVVYIFQVEGVNVSGEVPGA